MQTKGINNSPSFGMKLNVAKGMPSEVLKIAEEAKALLPDNFTLTVGPNTWNELGKVKSDNKISARITEKLGFLKGTRIGGAATAQDSTGLLDAIKLAVTDALKPVKKSKGLYD